MDAFNIASTAMSRTAEASLGSTVGNATSHCSARQWPSFCHKFESHSFFSGHLLELLQFQPASTTVRECYCVVKMCWKTSLSHPNYFPHQKQYTVSPPLGPFESDVIDHFSTILKAASYNRDTGCRKWQVYSYWSSVLYKEVIHNKFLSKSLSFSIIESFWLGFI